MSNDARSKSWKTRVSRAHGRAAVSAPRREALRGHRPSFQVREEMAGAGESPTQSDPEKALKKQGTAGVASGSISTNKPSSRGASLSKPIYISKDTRSRVTCEQ